MLVGTSGKDEMLGAPRLIGVTREIDRAVIGRGLAVNQALRVERTRSAGAIGHAFRDAAAVRVHEPGEVQHFAERHRAEIEVEAGDKDIVIGIEQVSSEEKEVDYELAFVDGDELDALADLLFDFSDLVENRPWIG